MNNNALLKILKRFPRKAEVINSDGQCLSSISAFIDEHDRWCINLSFTSDIDDLGEGENPSKIEDSSK